MSEEYSKTPITDGINRQFDAWDAQIDDLKNKSREAAKEQAEKIKKDIKDYTEKKKEELQGEKEETEEKSSAAKAVAAIKDGISSIDDAVGAINKILKFVGDSALYLVAVAADIAKAPTTLVNRANQSLAKLATPPSEQFEPIPEDEPEETEG